MIRVGLFFALMLVVSLKSHAAVNLSGVSELELPPQLKVHDNGSDNICNSTMPNSGIKIIGSYSLTGTDTAKYLVFAKDKQDKKIYLKTLFAKSAIIEQAGVPKPSKDFKFYIFTDDICDTNPGQALTVGELTDYILKLNLAAELSQ